MPEQVEQQTAQTQQDQKQDLDTMFVKAAQDTGQQQAATAPTAGSIPAQQAQPTTTEITDAMAAAKELGVDVTRFKSPADLVRAMYSRLSEADQYAQLGQRFAPHAKEFDEWLASRSKPVPQEKPPQQTDEWDEERHWSSSWNPPQYKAQWDMAVQLGVVESTDSGMVKASSPEYAGMAQEINEYLIAKREWDAGQRSVNPHKSQWDVQKPVLERFVKQMLDGEIKQAFEQYRAEQELSQWKSWLDQNSYEPDPLTGKPSMNAWRQKFDQSLAYLEQRYPGASQTALLEDALAMAGQPGQSTTATAAAQQTVAQVSAQKKDDFLRGAQAMSPGVRDTGIAPSAVTDQPPGSEAELATMFLEAGRQLEARPR